MFVAILKEMRIRQWLKNTFIFIPLVFDRQLFIPESFIRTLIGFFVFCFLSSTVYIINDIFDAEADRVHPKKRLRPIASGILPVKVALVVAVFYLLTSLIIGFILSRSFFLILLIYFLINLIYSYKLKHVPILDVMIIAAGFVLRVAAGVTIIQVDRFSPWLYVVTSVLALFLALGKRRGELATILETNHQQRRVLEGYTLPFLDQLITIISATTIISYSFYTFSAPNLPGNHAMMLTIPFALFGIFRYLYLIQTKNEGGSPEELVFSDRPLQATFIFFIVAIILIFYIF